MHETSCNRQKLSQLVCRFLIFSSSTTIVCSGMQKSSIEAVSSDQTTFRISSSLVSHLAHHRFHQVDEQLPRNVIVSLLISTLRCIVDCRARTCCSTWLFHTVCGPRVANRQNKQHVPTRLLKYNDAAIAAFYCSNDDGGKGRAVLSHGIAFHHFCKTKEYRLGTGSCSIFRHDKPFAKLIDIFAPHKDAFHSR